MQMRSQQRSFLGYRFWIFCFIAFLSLSVQSNATEAKDELTLIFTAADRICNVVSSSGEVNSSETKLALNAELSGLARSLAEAGISGSRDVSTEQYQGVLRKDLASVLNDNIKCRTHVFDILQEKLISSTQKLPSPLPQQAFNSSSDLSNNPTALPTSDSPMKDCHRISVGNWCLYQCINKVRSIECMVVATQLQDGLITYTFDPSKLKDVEFVDNFRENHPAVARYYVTGHGKHVPEVKLARGDFFVEVWEFGGETKDVTSGRIIFAAYDRFSLAGPVEGGK